MRKTPRIILVVVLLILGSLSSTCIANSQQKRSITSMIKTMNISDPSRDEHELKYYTAENLDQVIGISSEYPPPLIWQTAIRLTQDEMAPYMNWTLTKVKVAFSGDNGQPEIDVAIFIYEKGNVSTKPGPVIVQDTTAHLDTTGITTIPLVTPVDLAGHDELWVAVQWVQTVPGPGVYYAWIDTLSGPHVPEKSDFIFKDGIWNQFHDLLPIVDGRWGIGAVIEHSPPQPPQPPNKPVISGPENGTINISYSYTFHSNDPEEDDIYYFIKWGDGTTENWIGPYASGGIVTVPHIWSKRGTYKIQAKAKDQHDMESPWSEPLYMTIKGPILTFGNMTPGFGMIHIDIKNIGDADATNVEWIIKITGGLLDRTLMNVSQVASIIPPGGTVSRTIRPIIGFGWISISMIVRADYTSEFQKKTDGFLLFFIIFLLP